MKFHCCFLFVVFALMAGCSDSPGPAKDAAPASSKDAAKPAAKLEATTVGTFKGQKFGNVYLGGQPSADDLKQLNEDGVRTVINLRAEGENKDFDEAKLLSDLRAMYHNPGFNSPETLSDPIFRRVRDLLRNKANEPVLLHCASGNRVGAVWLAHRVLDDGVPYEQALEEAKAIGMKPAYEPVVKKYIDSKPE